jgi:hypothetical protein
MVYSALFILFFYFRCSKGLGSTPHRWKLKKLTQIILTIDSNHATKKESVIVLIHQKKSKTKN